ncbi:hypothetical protein ACGYRY_32345, partial [Burkholderia pseudomallei]
MANSVQYDSPAHTSITLGGASATSPVKITNLAAGANPSDAVNYEQLTSLSTSASTGLSSANSAITSLSTSTSTGIGSLS